MDSDWFRKGCEAQFTYAAHTAKTAEVHILTRDLQFCLTDINPKI
jgi:hypothetical protein